MSMLDGILMAMNHERNKYILETRDESLEGFKEYMKKKEEEKKKKQEENKWW